jgi:glycosyltransferase involved in cell wall biosynthesis
MLPDPPALSVLLPLYDCAPYLEAAAESISAQTFRNFEVVAVDDGSEDSTGLLAQEWAARDERVRVLRQPHRGLVAALNRGLAACRAPLIGRMDGDDIALPARFERQVQVLTENPRIGVVGCRYAEIREGELVPGPTVRTEPGLLAWRTLFFSPVVHATAVFRREVLHAVGGYAQGIQHVAEDYNLMRRLSRVTRLSNVSEVLYLYRRHAASSTSYYAELVSANCARVCQLALEELVGHAVPIEVARQVWNGTHEPSDSRPAAVLVEAFKAFTMSELTAVERRLVLRDVLWQLVRGGSVAQPSARRLLLCHPAAAVRALLGRARSARCDTEGV